MKVTDATEVFFFLKFFKSNFLRSRCVLHNFVNSVSFCLMFCTKTIETEKFSVWRADFSTVIESKEDLAHAQKISRNFVYNFSVSHSNGIIPDLNQSFSPHLFTWER